MNNTALGAVSNKKENIRFISEAHEKFYYEKLKEVRYVDVYHKALCYCLGISEQDAEEQIDECRRYSAEDLFCCCYAPFFWQAIQIRYPEYANYNHALHAMFGGND